MKFILAFLLLFINYNQIIAQDQTQEEVISEGIKLYKAELTSWNATDLFSEKYAEKSDLAGGSFSYAKGAEMICVFFSKASNPTVIATFVFDSNVSVKSGQVDKKERMFTKFESELYIIQYKTIVAMATDIDFFKRYSNTSLVIVPLIDSVSKKVYIITGVKQSCMVIFGNDYLIGFDSYNKIIYKKYLHKNIMPVECAKDINVDVNNIPGTMHLHNVETGSLPTPTDICSLLLYSKQANWKKHTIFSPESVSIWNCETSQLSVMTKEAWRIKYGVKK
ncbi:MAG: hypothetical protein Q8M15_04735 [Bacteroidota bacterium]|nr:hypothetical protein [Bacteroidota bacterium]